MTKKNHFNPCFWTAYWNFEYLKSKRENQSFKDSVREIKVFCLNLKSDKILNSKTEDIFIEKRAGLALITPDAALDFTLRNFPESYDEIRQSTTSELTIDFEDHFSKMEEAYRPALEQLILLDIEINLETKAHLAHFIFYQTIRNPVMFNSMETFAKSKGMEKFEMFYTLKHELSNPDKMKSFIFPLVIPEWTIYRLKKNVFPLSDSAVLAKKSSLMCVIAPNIMIEINFKKKVDEIQLFKIRNRISYFKYRDFLRRTINNSNRAIIFGEINLLEKIRKMRAYKAKFNNLNVC